MQDDELIHMANQIALNFDYLPEDEARAAVADHLRKFWDPRMRRELAAIAAAGPQRLHALVRAASGQSSGE